MTQYVYKAWNSQGSKVEGVVDALSEDEAKKKVEEMKLFPISVTPADKTSSQDAEQTLQDSERDPEQNTDTDVVEKPVKNRERIIRNLSLLIAAVVSLAIVGGLLYREFATLSPDSEIGVDEKRGINGSGPKGSFKDDYEYYLTLILTSGEENLNSLPAYSTGYEQEDGGFPYIESLHYIRNLRGATQLIQENMNPQDFVDMNTEFGIWKDGIDARVFLLVFQDALALTEEERSLVASEDYSTLSSADLREVRDVLYRSYRLNREYQRVCQSLRDTSDNRERQVRTEGVPQRKEEPQKAKPFPPSAKSAALEGVYHNIGIYGVIGRDFTAREFHSRLAIADRFATKANIILLFINSPGGSVSDLESIVSTMVKTRKRFIAIVEEKALSAAAVIALACDSIYITPAARIGAATPYIQAADGKVIHLPPAVQEKQFSAMRALVRIAAQRGGHSADLAEAMVDPNIRLTMTKVQTETGLVPVFERDGKGTVFSRKGEVLTLTADEAIDCGLARGIDKYEENLYSGKLVPLSRVAHDPLHDFVSDVMTQFTRAQLKPPHGKKASEKEAEAIAVAWAKKNHASANWWRQPLPLVVHSVRNLNNPNPRFHCFIVGKSLFGSRETIVAHPREQRSVVLHLLQKGDIVMIKGRLDCDSISLGNVGKSLLGRIAFNFRDCECTQDR